MLRVWVLQQFFIRVAFNIAWVFSFNRFFTNVSKSKFRCLFTSPHIAKLYRVLHYFWLLTMVIRRCSWIIAINSYHTFLKISMPLKLKWQIVFAKNKRERNQLCRYWDELSSNDKEDKYDACKPSVVFNGWQESSLEVLNRNHHDMVYDSYRQGDCKQNNSISDFISVKSKNPIINKLQYLVHLIPNHTKTSNSKSKKHNVVYRIISI